jgi:hypothetical protein
MLEMQAHKEQRALQLAMALLVPTLIKEQQALLVFPELPEPTA